MTSEDKQILLLSILFFYGQHKERGTLGSWADDPNSVHDISQDEPGSGLEKKHVREVFLKIRNNPRRARVFSSLNDDQMLKVCTYLDRYFGEQEHITRFGGDSYFGFSTYDFAFSATRIALEKIEEIRGTKHPINKLERRIVNGVVISLVKRFLPSGINDYFVESEESSQTT